MYAKILPPTSCKLSDVKVVPSIVCIYYKQCNLLSHFSNILNIFNILVLISDLLYLFQGKVYFFVCMN